MDRIEELERLSQMATHAKNRSFIKDEIERLRKQHSIISATSEAASKDEADATECTAPPIPDPSSSSSSQKESATSASETAPVPPTTDKNNFVPIRTFFWDQGSYGSKHENRVTVYVEENMDGVGEVKDNVKCTFTRNSFDLKILSLNGKNYRMIKTGLEKDIVPDECRCRVKKNKVLVYLRKKKGEFGFDRWNELCSSKKKRKKVDNDDPTSSINDMIRDLYDSGDDNMRKIIGESMLKARQGKTGTEGSTAMDFGKD